MLNTILEVFSVALSELKPSYAIAPLAMMALAQGIPALINLGKAASQKHQANKLAKTQRPIYDVPEAVKQAVQSARMQAAKTQLPGQNLMEQKLGQNTSNAIAELKNVSNNPNDLATNIQRIYQGQLGQQNNLNIAGAQNYQDNQGMLRGQLGQLGGYEDKAFMMNKMQPYMNDKAAEAALREGSFRNLSAAGTNIASGISGYGNMQYNQQMLDKLMANQGGNTGNTGSVGSTGVPNNTATGMVGGLNGINPDIQTPADATDPQELWKKMLIFKNFKG